MLRTVVSVKTGMCLWLLVLFAILVGCTDSGGIFMVFDPGDSVEISEVSQTDDDSDIAESFPDEDEINIPPADLDKEDIPQEIMDEDESKEDEEENEPDLDEMEPESDETEAEEDIEPPLVEYSVFPDSEVQIEPCLRDRTHSSMHITNAVWSNGVGRTWFGAYNGIWIHDEEPSPLLHCDEEVGEKVICLDGRRVGDETELWAGFARGKVGRWRNGVWHFETVPEEIQDEVVEDDDVDLEDWQGMIWGLAVHEDGTLAVQGPLGLALRDPSGVWSVPSCPDVDWGMPKVEYLKEFGTAHYIDRPPFVGLRWINNAVYAGALQKLYAIDLETEVCSLACSADDGQLAILPSRTSRMLVGKSIITPEFPMADWENSYHATKYVGECLGNAWHRIYVNESDPDDDVEMSSSSDLISGIFLAFGAVKGGISFMFTPECRYFTYANYRYMGELHDFCYRDDKLAPYSRQCRHEKTIYLDKILGFSIYFYLLEYIERNYHGSCLPSSRYFRSRMESPGTPSTWTLRRVGRRGGRQSTIHQCCFLDSAYRCAVA